ncbi:nucleophile aminohydrolase [Pisolithus microcarpus]|nr:nucleophile aminohydrolase [Pisolithus microcarpus]
MATATFLHKEAYTAPGNTESSQSEELPLYTSYTWQRRNSLRWKKCLLACITVFAFLRFRHKFYRSTAPSVRNPAYLIIAEHGAVASENKRCSDVGVELMKDGGNAVDAAIGAAFCIGVVNMFSSGIGGGGFMTVRIPPRAPNASSEVYVVDFRETAPGFSNTTMFSGNPLSAKFGGLSVAVPGEIRGFEEAHRRWGSLPWNRLIQPSVDLAKQWTVDAELARRIQTYSRLMLEKDDWRTIFAPNGKPLVEGQTIRRASYARTLSILASDGPDAFYKGPIADALVRKIQETGGIMTHADLEDYAVKVERALLGTYRDKKVYTSKAPTSGPVLLHMLNLIERFDLAREGRTGLNVHRIVEAQKLRDLRVHRTRIGDPAFALNNSILVAEMPTKEFADLIAVNLTDDHTHSVEYYNPEFDIVTDHGTSHTSAIDNQGMAVSLTTTVNLVFGSLVLDPETGIILNDEMDDFSTPGFPNKFGLWPSPYNYPEPGKRPLSSIAPTIMEHGDGSFYLAVGGSGGSRIFPSIFQAILNLDWGLDVSEAIEYGRVHDQDRGHNVTVKPISRVAAVVQAVLQKDGVIFAASDSRKNGIAAGY